MKKTFITPFAIKNADPKNDPVAVFTHSLRIGKKESYFHIAKVIELLNLKDDAYGNKGEIEHAINFLSNIPEITEPFPKTDARP